jgi:molybdate transport system ATP-binding protein
VTIAVTLAGKLGPDFALDLAFEIPARGVTALLGPSGSGKTSLLRALAGLDRHRGTIRFEGEIWQDARYFIPAHLRRVGTIFQGMGLLPHLSVDQNLGYAIRRAGPGPFVREDIIARTGIGALLNRAPASLSGGEAQRAAIARALLSQPRLLLMDEPLSGLDADARDILLGEIQTLLGGLSIPALYVTHDASEATRLAARTIYMRAGRVCLP